MSGDGGFVLPPSMPQFPQNAVRRACACLLARTGWKLVGTMPDVPKLVMIAAPHSSWWDGIWGLLFRSAVGADIGFMAKRELFVGPLGWLLRKAGGIPIERRGAHGVVDEMAARFAAADRLWLGIAPEGTRRRVVQWKHGFWYIAHAADVPILPMYFDYPTKTIGFGPLFRLTGNVEADVAALRAFYSPWRGKHRGA
jgi:1-acyl-sn-glycerol-3-phosphate acyltransferase